MFSSVRLFAARHAQRLSPLLLICAAMTPAGAVLCTLPGSGAGAAVGISAGIDAEVPDHGLAAKLGASALRPLADCTVAPGRHLWSEACRRTGRPA